MQHFGFFICSLFFTRVAKLGSISDWLSAIFYITKVVCKYDIINGFDRLMRLLLLFAGKAKSDELR
jgi:hypothetical protein